jgi:nucleoside-diphosphate-sugar epimerase
MEDLVTSSVLREEVRRLSSQFWRGRRVLGRNGFKGAWFDVLIGYLLLAEDLALKPEQTPRALNFGPAELEMSVSEVLKNIARIRNRPVLWEAANPAAAIFSDAPRLAIDSSLARETLRWAPRLVGDAVFTETLNWYEAWLQGESMHLPSQSAVCRALAV